MSEAPTGGFEPLETYFPDDDLMMIQKIRREDEGQFWKMYFDGAMNMEGARAGTGVVLVSITRK